MIMRALHIFVKVAFLAAMGTLVSCYENVIDETIVNNPQEDKFEVVQITNQINLQELPENVDLNDLVVLTLSGETPVDASGTSQVETFECSMPQLLMLLDNNDNNGEILMMSRCAFHEGDKNQMSARSTAIAMVTLHPALSGVNTSVYGKLEDLIVKSQSFDKFETNVAAAIREGGPLFDPDNTALVTSLNEVFEQVFSNGEDDGIDGELSTDDSADDLYSTLNTRSSGNEGTSSIAGIYVGPFNVSTSGSRLIIENYALTPFYSGTVSHHGQTDEFNIPAGGDWGLTYYFTSSHNSSTVSYQLGQEGRYDFVFSIDEKSYEDFAYHVASYMFDMIGLIPAGVHKAGLVSDFTDFMIGRGVDVGSLMLNPSTDLLDVLYDASKALVDYIEKGYLSNALEKIGYKKVLSSAVLRVLKNVNGYLVFYDKFNGTANLVLRTMVYGDSPKKVSFSLYYYNGEITSATEASLEKSSGDHQCGLVGRRLNLPVKVKVTTIGDDGSVLESSNFHKVLFEALDNSGRPHDRLVPADASGYASTYWTLEPESTEIQHMRAVVVDVVTGEEISEEVIFEAEPTVDANVAITLEWTSDGSKCDLDLHVIDPAGHHLYFWNKRCSCGGYLDRDDTYGPGPEHVYYTDAKPGKYNVYVHHFISDAKGNVGFALTTEYNERTYVNRSSAAYDQVVYVGTLVVDDNATKSPETYFYYDENAPVLSTADIPRKNEQ